MTVSAAGSAGESWTRWTLWPHIGCRWDCRADLESATADDIFALIDDELGS
ncbi:hypothetical protein ACFRQM_17105 [Streptomyces sp. NPDC056831]|uniref:hypothetical protein n=1 Tax=Streptomyces sp. NPDC056831 TaxID=3345954 RepID=UPI0036B52948